MQMHVQVVRKQIQAVPADVLVLNLYERIGELRGAIGAVDTALGASNGLPGDGAISRVLQLGDFKGHLNELLVLYTDALIPAPRVIVVGLGKPEGFTLERARQASATAFRKARDLGCKTVATVVFGGDLPEISMRDAAQATVEGALLGLYQFKAFKRAPRDTASSGVETVLLVDQDARKIEAVTAGAEAGERTASAIANARTWVNMPPNALSPADFADEAVRIAKESGLRCEILSEPQMRNLGMHSALAAARGSVNTPRLVVLEHVPAGMSERAQPDLVLVGKGVTFDSGGYSIKTADGMLMMKGDMGGGAAVIGAMQAIAGLQLNARVLAVVPMIENMISGDSMRPGDIVTTMSGITVEIVNTDAEGRLVLCDALTYAKTFRPKAIVDIATLTAQSVMAMGEGVAASLLATDDALADLLLDAAGIAGERLWRMPLFPEYGDKIRSDYADIKNSAGSKGGLGATAYFLKRFIDGADACAWAHIDMAGMQFSPGANGYAVRGATGFGVRLLVELARAIATQNK